MTKAAKQEYVVSTEEKATDLPTDGSYIILHVEVGFPTKDDNGIAIESPVPDLVNKIVSSAVDFTVTDLRGTKTVFSDLRLLNPIEQEDDQVLFKFEVYQKVPNNIPLNGNFAFPYVCSFVELCWYSGAAPIDKNMIPPVITNKNPNSIYQDLGWVLPARFVDSIAVSLGVFNSELLGGLLIDALLYGPFYITQKVTIREELK